jgi:hypothetical protein
VYEADCRLSDLGYDTMFRQTICSGIAHLPNLVYDDFDLEVGLTLLHRLDRESAQLFGLLSR